MKNKKKVNTKKVSIEPLTEKQLKKLKGGNTATDYNSSRSNKSYSR